MRPLLQTPFPTSLPPRPAAAPIGDLAKLGDDILVTHLLPRCTEQGFLPGFSETSRHGRRLTYQCALAHLHMGADSATTLGSHVPPLPEHFWATTREAQAFINRFIKPSMSFHAGIEIWAEQESRYPDSRATEAMRLLIAAYNNKDTKLELAKLGLRSLPSQISCLSDLQTLDLSDNKLRAIPPSILKLDQLRELDVSNNCLQTLPSDIHRLTKLEELFLFNNEIKDLPLQITRLSRLHLLQANHNKLVSLPPMLPTMQSLKRIMVAHNQLTFLPQGIAHMNQLEGLWLDHNALTDIEDAIAFLPKLRFITIEGNELTSPVTAITRFIEAHKPSQTSLKSGASRTSNWFDWFLR